jgi:HTH-type transcriptional regulator / antitoxin HipB
MFYRFNGNYGHQVGKSDIKRGKQAIDTLMAVIKVDFRIFRIACFQIVRLITAKAAMIPLSQLIQSHRKKAALTQAQLAKLAGVGKTVVWDLEHGKQSVQWDTLQKIFQVLNITVEWRSPLLERAAAATVSPSAPSSTAAPRSSSSPTPSPKQPRLS